jgi:hypothetical protein
MQAQKGRKNQHKLFVAEAAARCRWAFQLRACWRRRDTSLRGVVSVGNVNHGPAPAYPKDVPKMVADLCVGR